MTPTFYRHTYGGYYRFVAHARSADNMDEVVVYEHLWPFEQSLWVRNRTEFEARFRPIDEAEVVQAQQGDRAAAQAAVEAARASSRAARATGQ